MGDRFSKTADLHTDVERCFIREGGTVRRIAEVRAPRANFYQCDGAIYDAKAEEKNTRGCQAVVRACLQTTTLEWKVTVAELDHQNCASGTKKAGLRALQEEATAIVKQQENHWP